VSSSFTAAALSLLSVLLGFFLRPESLPREGRETAPIRAGDLNPFTSISAMARKPGLGWLLSAFIFPTLTVERVSPREQGALMGVTTAAAA
jgi:hypothetical protein